MQGNRRDLLTGFELMAMAFPVFAIVAVVATVGAVVAFAQTGSIGLLHSALTLIAAAGFFGAVATVASVLIGFVMRQHTSLISQLGFALLSVVLAACDFGLYGDRTQSILMSNDSQSTLVVAVDGRRSVLVRPHTFGDVESAISSSAWRVVVMASDCSVVAEQENSTGGMLIRVDSAGLVTFEHNYWHGGTEPVPTYPETNQCAIALPTQ